jgi:hypothetical protein
MGTLLDKGELNCSTYEAASSLYFHIVLCKAEGTILIISDNKK